METTWNDQVYIYGVVIWKSDAYQWVHPTSEQL